MSKSYTNVPGKIIFQRSKPSDELLKLEWGGVYAQCQFCGNFPEDSKSNPVLSRALPKSMKGHAKNCRWILEMQPRIAYLKLQESGHE